MKKPLFASLIFFYFERHSHHFGMKKKSKDKNTPRQKLYIYLFLRVTKSFHYVKRNVLTNLYSINLIITNGSRNRNYKKWETKSSGMIELIT
jgi:hypothetical protein